MWFEGDVIEGLRVRMTGAELKAFAAMEQKDNRAAMDALVDRYKRAANNPDDLSDLKDLRWRIKGLQSLGRKLDILLRYVKDEDTYLVDAFSLTGLTYRR